MKEMPDASRGAEDLARVDVGEVCTWLASYNRQFGVGRLLGRTLLADVPRGELMQTTLAEQRRMLMEVSESAQKTLQQSGLSLERVESGGMVASTKMQNADMAAEMRINLDDGKQFVRYLESLKGGAMTESQKSGLAEVARSLTAQVRTHYNLEHADEKALELFGNASRILEEYDRLDIEGASGMAEAAAELKNLINLAKNGYLREQLLTEEQGLLAEVGGDNFGPSKWHTDSSGDDYTKRWTRALDAARTIGKNPKAAELYGRVAQNLLESAMFAHTDITTNPQYKDRQTRYERHLALLQEVIADLKRQKSPSGQR